MKKILIIWLFLGLAATAHSQAEPDFLTKRNKLNGHTFMDFSRFNSPFISTSLKINVGAGSTSVITIPPLEIDGITTPAIKGTIMFTEAGLTYRQRFTPWLSLFIHSAIIARYGSDAFSLLYDGVNTVSGGAIGWQIKMVQTKKLILTSSVFVNNLSGSFINIREFVNDIIDTVPNPSIIKNTPALTGGVGISGAYAFNQTWGIQAESQLIYGETFIRDVSKVKVNTTILGEADFYAKYNFPLGIGFGYIFTSIPETSIRSGNYVSIGVFKLAYTGSPDFDLGLEYMTYKMKLDGQLKNPFVSQFIFSFKFFF